MDISFIVIIYNVEEYLDECLRSVWANACSIDAEVLLIDDGSTDGSSAIAQAFADAHKNVAYYHKENGGASTARNYGVRLAKGDYLYFVDGDDVMVKGTVRTMLTAARSSGAQITICDAARLNPNGKARASLLHTLALTTVPSNHTNIHEHPELLYDCLSWDKLICRSFYEQSGVTYPEGFAIQDYPTITELYLQAERVRIVRAVGYLWRVREGDNLSTTQRQMERKNLTDRIEMIRRVFGLLDAYGAEDSIRFVAEHKLLAMDVGVYLSKLYQMDAADASGYVELMAACVESLVRPESVDNMPLKIRQRTRYLLDRDVEALIRLENYIAESYDAAIVRTVGDRLLVDVPQSLFTIESKDFHADARLAIPRSRVEDITCEGGHITLTGFLFTPRIEIQDPSEQAVSAYLLNDRTGKTIPLECASCARSSLSKARTRVISRKDYDAHEYHYEGTGYRLTIDLAQIDAEDGLSGDNQICIGYKNWIQEGARILRGNSAIARAQTKKLAYNGRYGIKAVWDKRDTFTLRIEDRGALVAPGIREADLEPATVAVVVQRKSDDKGLERCIRMLQRQDYKNIKIVVAGEVATLAPDDSRVVDARALGLNDYSSMLHYAYARMGVDYVLPLLDDVTVDNDYVKSMVDALDVCHTQLAICAQESKANATAQNNAEAGQVGCLRIATDELDCGQEWARRSLGDAIYASSVLASCQPNGYSAQELFVAALKKCGSLAYVPTTRIRVQTSVSLAGEAWSEAFDEMRMWHDVAEVFDVEGSTPHDSAQSQELACALRALKHMGRKTDPAKRRQLVKTIKRLGRKEARCIDKEIKKMIKRRLSLTFPGLV